MSHRWKKAALKLGALDRNWIDNWDVLDWLQRQPVRREDPVGQGLWEQESQTVQLARKSQETKSDRYKWALPQPEYEWALKKLDKLVERRGGMLVIEGNPSAGAALAGRMTHKLRCALFPTYVAYEEPDDRWRLLTAPVTVFIEPPRASLIDRRIVVANKGMFITIINSDEPVDLPPTVPAVETVTLKKSEG